MDWRTLLSAGNLLLDIKQSADLQQANQQLSNMQQITLQDALRKEYLEMLKNFIFNAYKRVELLEQYSKKLPVPVYVTTRLIESGYKEIGITPNVFPDFVDKEYVTKFQDKVDGVLTKTRNGLSKTDLDQAEECVSGVLDMPLLEKVITSQGAQEQLNSLDGEWKELEGYVSARQRKGVLSLIGIVVFPVVVACLGSAIAQNNRALGQAITIIMLIGPLVLLGYGIYLLATKFPSGKKGRYAEIANERDRLRVMLANQEESGQIVEKFGSLSSQEYLNLKEKRQTLIKKIIEDVEGDEKLLNALSGVI